MGADPHRAAAATIAERIRRDRAQLVAELASGSLDPVDLVAPGPAAVRAGPVKAVVVAQAVPGVGKVGSRRVLAGLGVTEDARWGDLAPALAARLVTALVAAAEARRAEAAAPVADGPDG